MRRTPNPNLSLFGEAEVKPESRKEKRAKQGQPLRSREEDCVTMADLWKHTSSIETKCIHWSTSGPYGGSTTHAACGAKLQDGNARSLVEEVTCERCRDKATEAWEAMTRYSRGIDVDNEEE